MLAAISAGTHDFSPGACDRLEGYVSSELVGQELAVHQAADAICDHIAQAEPQKPLVLSAHGPPGVGKSLLHLLLARALYSKHPADLLKCPGTHCLGYKASFLSPEISATFPAPRKITLKTLTYSQVTFKNCNAMLLHYQDAFLESMSISIYLQGSASAMPCS